MNAKFRAWNIKTKQMIDLHKITPFALCPELNQDGIFIPFSDDLIIEQSTGLLDENGKEIYEGDMVIKRFENPKGNFLERKIVVEIPGIYSDWFGLDGDFEIIGTIHDGGGK
jgi:uncharacterized phage protein (TIGR01671 family)